MTLRSSVEHHRRVRARLGQRVRAHAQQQRLERLAGAVDADVRQRRRGQDAPGGVARLRLDRLLVDEVGVAGLLRVALARPVDERAAACRRTCRTARPCRRCSAHRGGDREHRRRSVVAVAPAEPRVVRDVARRLLEVRHEPAPLEDLGEQVRRLLAREVHATELRDGVVAVLEEHAVVELLGAAQPDGRVDGEVAGEVEVADELVEEEAPQALRRCASTARTARPSRPRAGSPARTPGGRGS